MARRFRRKDEERHIARRRIARLFEVAHLRIRSGEPDLAHRAVGLARRIGMRYQTGLAAEQRDRVCRGCGNYLAPGSTARIRVRAGATHTTCLRCGRTMRRPYRREQKARRLERAARRSGAPAAPEPTLTTTVGAR